MAPATGRQDRGGGGSALSAGQYALPLMRERPTSLSGAAVVAAAGLTVGAVVGLTVSLLLGPLAGLAALAIVWAAVAATGWLGSGAVVLRLAGGAPPPLDAPRPARLANLVESVAVAIGIPEPALIVVDDPAPNALVTGPDPRRATLVVTSGLLDRLDRLALEAVIAQQLSIIRAGTTRGRDVAVAILGTAGQLVPPLGRLAARAVDVAAGGGADVAAVTITRYPPGLLAALDAVAAGPEVSASAALAPLWFVPPGRRQQLALRLDTMRELL